MVVVSHKVAKDTMVVDDAKLVNNYMMDDTQGMDMDISRCSKIGKGGEQHLCIVEEYIKVINTKVVEFSMLLDHIMDLSGRRHHQGNHNGGRHYGGPPQGGEPSRSHRNKACRNGKFVGKVPFQNNLLMF